MERRRTTNAFLRWCVANRTMPRLRIPHPRTENPAPISQHRRIGLIRRVVTDDGIPLRARVVTLLMLLYAQPISRIMRLSIDAVIRDGDQIALRLGSPPSPVPESCAGLLLEHLASRENTTTATKPDGTWLFPGRRAGQPLHPANLGKQLSALGITTLHARTATIRQLVLQAPPSVVAGMLGYHVVHTEAVAVQAGGTWKKYAPGEHPTTTQDPGTENTDYLITGSCQHRTPLCFGDPPEPLGVVTPTVALVERHRPGT